jgi:glycosyltransferase involved in cell wall biosynthesis
VVVVDDGCTDGTFDVAQRWAARDTRIQVHRHDRNLGYGASVRDGLEKARESGCDIAVCLHADGQYPPELVLPLARRMELRSLDLLQGSRHKEGGARRGGMPLYKIVAGKSLAILENAVFHQKLTDYHSGFLFYSRSALDRIPFDRLGVSFDFDLQVIACACALRLAVGEEPIPTRYAGEVSHLDPLAYGVRVLLVLLRYGSGKFHKLCSPTT